MAYSTLDEVFTLGLAAQAFQMLPRPFDAVDAATATIRLRAHGLTLDDVITFEVSDGGALPTAISAFQPYYPIPVTADLFQVALTPNGTPIASWVSAGEGWGVTVDTRRRIQAHAEETAAEIDEALTADTPPIKVDPVTGKYPQQLIGLNARMTARAAVLSLQVENAAYRVAIDRLFSKEKADQDQLAIWRSGKPLNPRPTDQTAIPDNAAIASGDTPTPWRTGFL